MWAWTRRGDSKFHAGRRVMSVHPHALAWPDAAHSFASFGVIQPSIAGIFAGDILTSERPQGRAAPNPPPAGAKETWGGPAFP
jgi:hypothetical protein